MRQALSQKGFTLVELLVALAIAGIVATAMVNTFASQSITNAEQEQIVDMQQDLRAGFDLLAREIRMAAFNPARAAGIGWVTAEASQITFSMDLNGNGSVVGDVDEYVSYAVSNIAGISSLGRKGSPGAINFGAVAENIVALGFAYAFDTNDDGALETDAGQVIWAVPNGGNWFDLDVNDDGLIDATDDTDGDGTITGTDTGIAADVVDIRAVRIWVLAKTESTSRGQLDSRSYVVGNQVVTPNDKSRYRLLTSIERCRNAGL